MGSLIQTDTTGTYYGLALLANLICMKDLVNFRKSTIFLKVLN